ncbi:uncharacterized protein CC84DRAFT_1220643 [Paraphaeosphaeria sporulosa]|uniref:Uncharacterized protein n=1 Tax=Paraphaeosphaeria sporulosa TaxID=1460663 RepID=A0A177C5Z6_9PLEO|nr:uncharacterized protein CC84DRAFT_1220643 [Paraphaeosphaeria sporulosa]OAG02302.1 hypothetical protein CC84DRAFT_1220643 [Paraphaeosphaeria sporulosa]
MSGLHLALQQGHIPAVLRHIQARQRPAVRARPTLSPTNTHSRTLQERDSPTLAHTTTSRAGRAITSSARIGWRLWPCPWPQRSRDQRCFDIGDIDTACINFKQVDRNKLMMNLARNGVDILTKKDDHSLAGLLW